MPKKWKIKHLVLISHRIIVNHHIKVQVLTIYRWKCLRKIYLSIKTIIKKMKASLFKLINIYN